MKKTALVILLLFCALAWAGTNPNLAEYTINVHVNRSRMVHRGGSAVTVQKLDVVIDGKKYELESDFPVNALLSLGDYQAKLAKDEHRSAYDARQIYEFLFPDNKTRKFIVVGQTE